MTRVTTLRDLIGIEDIKLGFFQEVQAKVEELKRSNRELELKQQEIQAILDGIVDVMVVLSEDLRITSVNHVFRSTFREPEPEGKFCYQVFRSQNRPCEGCPAARAMQKNRVARDSCTLYLEGRQRHFEILASPLQRTGDSPDRVVLFKRDITLEKEYQTQYLQAEKMATVGVLAAGVAHEINNPLTAISGFSEGLQRRISQIERNGADAETLGDMQEYVRTVLEECNRCRDIVQTLLTFSRPAGSGFRPLALGGLVRDCIRIMDFRLKKAPNVRLDVDLAEDVPMVSGDEAQLKQVVLNLVVNALDAVQGEGRITLRARAEAEGGASLLVEDDGPGIPEDHLNRLFDPFFTTKPVGQGTGIGLSTCYNIVRTHGGTLYVCSEPGRGSSFCVRFPSGASEDG
jgi:hypothetical protein